MSNRVVAAQFMYYQSLIIDKKQNQKIIAKYELAILTKNNLNKKFNFINASKNQQSYNIKVREANYLSFKIFEIVKRYKSKHLTYTRSRKTFFKRKKYQQRYLYIKYQIMR